MNLPELLSTYQRQLVNVTMSAAGLAVIFIVSFLLPRLGTRFFAPIERLLSRLAAHRAISITLVGLVSLLVGLLVVAIAGPPIPHIHDEFSYLLAADTFARGRLTNPPHEMWRHFETMHVLFQPTYASKFHPAQGLTLSFGQVVFGAPWIGAILSTALGCAALAWALFGWLRPRWALLGGLLSTIHPQIVIWSHQYWGGSVGMIGGSLVLGAIARILRSEDIARNSAWLALGGAILATSRPYEAMVWGILSSITLLGWLLRNHVRDILRLIVPTAAVLAPVVVMIGYYNWRVTGQWRELPYTLHTKTYMSVPLLYWQDDPPPKVYSNQQLRDQHQVFEWEYFHGQRSLRGWLAASGYKIYFFSELHLLRNLALLFGLFTFPFAIGRSRWMCLAAAYAIAFLVAYGSIPWFEHHYPGAVMALLFVVALRGLRGVRAWKPAARRAGQTLVWLCIVSSVLVLPTVVAREYRNTHGGWWFERHKIVQQLSADADKHLVFAHYASDHPPGHEWVFNEADIDDSKIVWARQLGENQDHELIEYYPNRKVWIVYADEYPARLQPFSEEAEEK